MTKKKAGLMMALRPVQSGQMFPMTGLALIVASVKMTLN
jgi:hypothetical protein